VNDLTRYHAMTVDLARKALRGRDDREATDDSVAMATAAAWLLLDDEPGRAGALVAGMKRLAEMGLPWSSVGVTLGMTQVTSPTKQSTNGPIMLADTGGERRDVYHPLVLHLHLQAFSRQYESLPVSAWSACEDAVPEAVAPTREVEGWTETPPPAP